MFETWPVLSCPQAKIEPLACKASECWPQPPATCVKTPEVGVFETAQTVAEVSEEE